MKRIFVGLLVFLSLFLLVSCAPLEAVDTKEAIDSEEAIVYEDGVEESVDDLEVSDSVEDGGNVNLDFSLVSVESGVQCYQSEELRSFAPGASGKILVELVSDDKLHIAWENGSCTGSEKLLDYEVYIR